MNSSCTENTLEDYQTLTVCFLLATGIIGAVLNALLLALSYLKKDLRDDCTIFLNTMAFLNLIYCINNCTLEAFSVLKNEPGNGTMCTLASLIFVTSGFSCLVIQPFYAMNKYWTLFYPEKVAKYYSYKKSLIMISCTIIFCLVIALARFGVHELGRIECTLCGIELGATVIAIEVASVIPKAIFTKLCVYSAIKIRRFYKSDDPEKVAQWVIRLPDAQDIFKFIIICILVQTHLELPMMVVSICMRFKVNVSRMVIAVVVCLQLVYSLLYPIIVVVCLKPYRKCILQLKYGDKVNSENTVVEMYKSNVAIGS